MTKSWYCICSKPKQEYKARDNLGDQYGAENIFLPEIRVDKRKKNKSKSLTEVLFPNYLFARLGIEQDWSPIKSTPGVLHLVYFGNDAERHYPSIHDSIIEDFRRYDESLQHDYHKGDKVIINTQSFINVEGIVLCPKLERVKILMNFLGGAVTAEVDRVNIEPKEA